MFFKHSKEGKRAIFIVVVDDIILTEDYITEIEKLKKALASEFEIKDLGKILSWDGICKIQEGNFHLSKEVCAGFIERDRNVGL